MIFATNTIVYRLHIAKSLRANKIGCGWIILMHEYMIRQYVGLHSQTPA